MCRTHLRRACSQNDHVGFALGRDLQDAIRCVPKFQDQSPGCTAVGVLGNQFLQAMAILFDRPGITSQLGIVLDHVHQGQAGMKFFGERGRVLGGESCVAGESW